jgi:hypothetical protein
MIMTYFENFLCIVFCTPLPDASSLANGNLFFSPCPATPATREIVSYSGKPSKMSAMQEKWKRRGKKKKAHSSSANDVSGGWDRGKR